MFGFVLGFALLAFPVDVSSQVVKSSSVISPSPSSSLQSSVLVTTVPPPQPPTQPPKPQAPCGLSSEWEYFEGYCYWSSSFNRGVERMNTWFGAQIDCRHRGGDLVSIHSERENYFIHKKTHCAKTWTGLTVTDHRKRTKPEGHQWIDGTRRTYLNWYPGMPAGDSYARHNCYYLHDSTGAKWYHGMCSNTHYYYVCKKRASSTPQSPMKSHKIKEASYQASKCEKGWTLEGNKCMHVNNTRVDFFEAMLQCHRMDSYLATLHSAREEAMLSRVFDSCDTPWIGLENVDPNKVGTNHGWRWNDDSVLSYTNWKNVVPTNDKQQQCGRLERGLSWVNTHCWNLHPFVCEKKPKD